MGQYIDLHTHSTFSDGTFTPLEIVLHAKALSLGAISITDHDCMSGIKEGQKAAQKEGIEFITGIELCCYYQFEFHLLGYFFDPDNQALKAMVDGLAISRVQRNKRMIEKLADLGFDISMDDFTDCPGSTLTRAHIGRVLAQKGYVKDISDAFSKIIGKGKKGYVEREKLDFSRAADILHKAGGKIYLAHLSKLPIKKKEEIYAFVNQLKLLGLDGIEGHYSEYSDEFENFCVEMAKDLALSISGGSDFHGAMRARELSFIQDGKRLTMDLLDEMKKEK